MFKGMRPFDQDHSAIYQNTNRQSCTIGVASGSATEDGRPLVWKTRDYVNNENTRVRFNTSQRYSVLMVTTIGHNWPVMGVNEKGFSMVFSLSDDLPQGSGMYSTNLMQYGLANCATIADFENVLDSTNITGRATHNNFAAIDTTGAAKIFEVAGSEYWTYDANDTLDAPNGYLVRTNFSPTHGTSEEVGIERYLRSRDLCEEFISGDSLNYKSLMRYHMRDFATPTGDPLEIPFTGVSQFTQLGVPPGGYCNIITIANFLSEASSVIQGVLPEESPALSTMWTILGMPATSIAIPYWPVGAPPAQASGAGVNELALGARQIRSEVQHDFSWVQYGIQYEYIDTYDLLDGNGGGIWPIIYPAEDSIFQTTDSLMTIWRNNGVDSSAMLLYSSLFAETGVTILNDAYTYLLETVSISDMQSMPSEFSLFQNYPNPFNPVTTIQYELPKRTEVQIRIYDLLGRKIATLVNQIQDAGFKSIQWNATDDHGKPVSAGSYLYQIKAGELVQTKKMVLLK